MCGITPCKRANNRAPITATATLVVVAVAEAASGSSSSSDTSSIMPTEKPMPNDIPLTLVPR
jgi:hypothetical protein